MRLSKLGKAEIDKNRGLVSTLIPLLIALLLFTQLSYASDGIDVCFIYDTNHSVLGTDNSNENQTNVFSADFLYSIPDQLQDLPLLHAVRELKSGIIKKHTPPYFIRAPSIYS